MVDWRIKAESQNEQWMHGIHRIYRCLLSMIEDWRSIDHVRTIFFFINRQKRAVQKRLCGSTSHSMGFERAVIYCGYCSGGCNHVDAPAAIREKKKLFESCVIMIRVAWTIEPLGPQMTLRAMGFCATTSNKQKQQQKREIEWKEPARVVYPTSMSVSSRHYQRPFISSSK